MARNSSTSSSSARPDSGRWPTALLACLSVILLVHLSTVPWDYFWKLCYLYGDIPREDPIRLEAALRTFPDAHRGRSVLLVGSSLTREGLDADYLNRRFEQEGLFFYNLGVAGSSQPLDLYMLKDRILERAPRMVLYMPFIESFYSDYQTNEYNQIHYHFDPNILAPMMRHFGAGYLWEKRKMFGDALLGQVSIYYRFRQQIVRIAERRIRVLLGSPPRTRPMRYQFDGRRPQEYFQKRLEGETYYGPGTYTELNQDLFVLFARELAARGVEFIVFDGPVSQFFYRIHDRRLHAPYDSFLRRQARELGFSYVGLEELPAFEESDFFDEMHLNASGRQRLTLFAEEYLRRQTNPKAKPPLID